MAGGTKKPPIMLVVPRLLLLMIGVLSFHGLVQHAAAAPEPKIRAVNLGGWLVAEGWIYKPDLFGGIVNNHLLDGTKVQLKSVTTKKYLSAEGGGGQPIVANRPNPSDWETFRLWRINESSFQFRVNNGLFWGLRNDGSISGMAGIQTPVQRETIFQIVQKGSQLVRIKASNGLYLKAMSETSVTAEATEASNWSSDDSSVFNMTVFFENQMQGEYQLTNGYGPNASSKLKEHWDTFIKETDFEHLSHTKLNAVRIPVGWWIASNPAPFPFVTGSLQKLDDAFDWADKYDLGVIIDLHAARGGQNPDAHSGTRDGTVWWPRGLGYIQETVGVIDFLAARYAKRKSLLAVELLNEPRAPMVTNTTLFDYYRQGYAAVRKYTSQAYVIFSSRIGADPYELLNMNSNGFQRTVIDVHYYNIYGSMFENRTAQWNIDYVKRERANQLGSLSRDGSRIFVGEWTASWIAKGATPADQKQYAAAQLEVFGQATFGWAFWTYKNRFNDWSLQWLIDNGLLTNRTGIDP